MKKVIIDESKYSFDANAKQIVFTDFIDLKDLLLITNIADNTIIYNFACSGFGGTLTEKILALEYDTRGMSNDDILQVVMYAETDEADDITHSYLVDAQKDRVVLKAIYEEQKLTNELLKLILS
jgi:hypothetical protein